MHQIWIQKSVFLGTFSSPWSAINTNLVPLLVSKANMNRLRHFEDAIQKLLQHSKMHLLFEKQGMVFAETIVHKTKSSIKPSRTNAKEWCCNEPRISHLPTFPIFFSFLFFFYIMPPLASPRRWSPEHRLHLPVLFQRNHPQVWRVLQQHLCHQVSSNWPCLVFPCLFTNVSA